MVLCLSLPICPTKSSISTLVAVDSYSTTSQNSSCAFHNTAHSTVTVLPADPTVVKEYNMYR